MKKIIIVIGIIALLAVAGFFLFGGDLSGNAVQDNSIKEFAVDAFRFGYTPDTITVNQGDRVRITIDNTDTPHGIRIPDLGIKANEVLEFTADKKGEFTWYCTNMCGNGHMQMQGKLIVR